MNSKIKGFTLIELLVVIAIIGILSSVVLASLNSARTRGADTSAKANLGNIRAQAELVYASSSSYATVCTDTSIVNMLASARQATGVAGCGATATSWVASARLNNPATAGFHWCVDSTGNAKEVNGTTGTSTGACI